MELKVVAIKNPEGTNIIIGQTHFIKTVEDIHEMMVTTVPGAQFGLAFCEASGARLVRTSGTNKKLELAVAKSALAVGAGHSFFLLIEGAYPINVLPGLKHLSEVCSIFCATANPLQLVVAETDQGRAILGVVDGESPVGVEKTKDKKERRKFLRKIGYKL